MFGRKGRHRQAGFTFVEILITVAVIGILSGIAIPNVASALRRARQRRTMCDMRVLGAALESYAADHNVYPSASAASCVPGVSFPPVEPLKPGAFSGLVPTYIAQPPSRDGWGRLFGYTLDSTGAFYLIQSRGEDGGDFEKLLCGPMSDFNDDIAYSNGNFVQWPSGGVPPSTLSKLAP